MEDKLGPVLEALLTYNWGDDKNVLAPLDEAIVATHGDEAARAELEAKLLDVLKKDITRDAKDVVCRRLTIIGTAASVPALAAMLSNADDAHMARYALQGMQCDEAGAALRDALPKLDGDLKIGVIGSLAVRKDEAAVALIAPLLSDSNAAIARSAALALGTIGTADAAKALGSAPASLPVTEASLECAESLLAAGNKLGAMAIYKGLNGDDRPSHVQLAAKRGLLACMGK